MKPSVIISSNEPTISRVTPFLTLIIDNSEIANVLEKHNAPKGLIMRYFDLSSCSLVTESLLYTDKYGVVWDWR